MKRIRTTLAAFTAALLLLLPCMVQVSAAGTTVTVRVEGIEETLFCGEVEVAKENPTAADVLLALDEQEDSLTMEIVDSAYGKYLSAVNDDKEGTYGAKIEGVYDGWMFLLNDVAPEVGIEGTEVKDGDSLVFYFGDSMTLGMQIPQMDTAKLESDGILSFTSEDTEYDANWNATVKTNPVADMTVVWGMEDGSSFTGTTDEDGTVTIPEEYRTAGEHTVTVSRYDESGCPTVLRFAPDTTVTLKTSAVTSEPESSTVTESTASDTTDTAAQDSSFPVVPVVVAVVIVIAAVVVIVLVKKRREA